MSDEFEKDAKDYSDYVEYTHKRWGSDHPNYGDVKTAYKKGAEAGYDFAKKWHYVKDKLPPSGETVLLYFGTDIMGQAVTCTGCVDCRGQWYKNIDEGPYMWQKIILPKD